MISLLGTTVTIKKAVDWTDLYDLASVTKITAILPGVMNWYEKQPLLLESTVGQQLPELATSDKGNLVLEDVLAHQAVCLLGSRIIYEPSITILRRHFGT